MSTERPRVLIATRDASWFELCKRIAEEHACHVDCSLTGFEALYQLEHMHYEVLIVDDTLPDLQPLEFVLNARDVVKNRLMVLVAGRDLVRYKSIWPKCKTTFTGDKVALLSTLGDTLAALPRSGVS